MATNELPAITEVEGVHGYVDETGTIHLNVGDIAFGLGFTQKKNGVEYVRLETVNRYLAEFGFSQRVGKDDYIPENMFYRLAMKANNEAAKNFQAKVADKILPSIRKNGVYMTPEAAEKILFNPDFIIGLAQQVKDARAERDAVLAQVAELKPKADYTEAVLESDERLTSELIAKEYGQCAQWLHALLVKLNLIYKRGRTWFMKAPYAKEGYRTSETRTLQRGKTVVQHYWTQRGRWFIYNKLKEIGIVPTAERKDPMATLPGMNNFTYDGGYAPRVM